MECYRCHYRTIVSRPPTFEYFYLYLSNARTRHRVLFDAMQRTGVVGGSSRYLMQLYEIFFQSWSDCLACIYRTVGIYTQTCHAILDLRR